MSEPTITSLQLEEASPDDANEIWNIIKVSFADEPHAPYIATGQAGYGIYLRDRLVRRHKDPRRLLLARSDGDIAAFADITLNEGNTNFLTRIAVAPEFRGRSVARALMQKIQATYRMENPWELDVLSTNPRAKKFYSSLGFKTVSQRKWIGRLLSHKNLGEVGREAHDSDYQRYGFTMVNLEGRTFAVAGKAIRCYETSTFLNDSILHQVHENFPQTDRAFIILEEEDNTLGRSPHMFEIVRSERMEGSF